MSNTWSRLPRISSTFTRKSKKDDMKKCSKIFDDITKHNIKKSHKPSAIVIIDDKEIPHDNIEAWKNIGELFKRLRYKTIYQKFFETNANEPNVDYKDKLNNLSTYMKENEYLLSCNALILEDSYDKDFKKKLKERMLELNGTLYKSDEHHNGHNNDNNDNNDIFINADNGSLKKYIDDLNDNVKDTHTYNIGGYRKKINKTSRNKV